MTHQILFGLTSQVLTHVPLGIVSSASYTLEDLHYGVTDSSRVIGSGSPTQASWTVTSTAVAGASSTNSRRISTTTTAGSIGAPAVIVAPDGSRELFEVAAISTNSYLESVSPLAGTYPVGSVVYGVQLSAPVPDAFAANEDRLKHNHAIRITWAYTFNGVKFIHPELVKFDRAQLADAFIGEAILWIDKLYPDARTRAEVKLEVVAPFLAAEVGNDLRARRIEPTRFFTGDRGRGLLVSRILAHLGELGWSPGNTPQEDWGKAAWRNYRDKLDSLTIGEPGFNTTETSPEDQAGSHPDRKNRSLFVQM